MTWKLGAAVPKPDPQQIVDAHLALIGQTAIEITILREVTGAEGTHRQAWHAEPVGGITTTAALRFVGGSSSNVSDLMTGHQERDTSIGLLLPTDVPLRSGDGEDGRSRLEFTHPTHGRLRLRRLRPWDIAGRIVGWQADLERIAGASPVPQPHANGGRRRLEDDEGHPWREIVRKAESLKSRSPRLSWANVAARLDVSPERLDEYRRRARAAQGS